jgi:uncharacterized protein YdeI (YjbR/CyaY-like superfamily)
MSIRIASGVVHTVPISMRKALLSNQAVLTAWNAITPLARNEWICWIESAKKNETKEKRLERMQADLLKGKRRPCCWAGCVHRAKDN